MDHQNNYWKGKVALVTGGNSGIGRATVLAFAALGVKVFFCGRRKSEGDDTVRQVHLAGGEAFFIPSDLTSLGEPERVVRETVDISGGLDFAFNNAGTETGMGALWKLNEDDWDKSISINLKAVWLCMKHEITAMISRGGGVVVNNSSISGLVGFSGSTIYGAAKAGVIGMTRSAAIEYARSQIRVHAIAPGAVATPMIERMYKKKEDLDRFVSSTHPMGRMARPEEVAETVVWLCSHSSSFITGQVLPVDGGYTAQ